MAAHTRNEIIQGIGSAFSVDEGVAIDAFEEYAFRAPRPGFFLGDSLVLNCDPNPNAQFKPKFENNDKRPPCPSSQPFLGALDVLATELLCHIYIYLDVRSLLAFHRVNQHAKKLSTTSHLFGPSPSFPDC
jgi:hypothetical protein